jgi:oligosaccharide repeat unit polymerase
LYCIAFSISIFIYFWDWSSIFPDLSSGLISFFLISFIIFIIAGKFMTKPELNFSAKYLNHFRYLDEAIFGIIVLMGLTNVLYMGYLPIIERSTTYKDFGMPVLDPLFNSLSIFFSVFFFQSYLEKRKKRLLIFVVIFLIIHFLIFRRSSILWILTSVAIVYILYRKSFSFLFMALFLLSIPVCSYFFGLYGKIRNDLNESVVLNELGASQDFKESSISFNHYMTYLYVSSPLANLQENINRSKGLANRGDIEDFIFYCLVPESVTIRLEKKLNLSAPACNLITPALIVGTFLMVSFYTLGWPGMIIMLIYLFILINLCYFLIRKWNTFSITTYSLLCTTVVLLIFSNFLNRLDVLMMLFVYPLLFHFIYKKT